MTLFHASNRILCVFLAGILLAGCGFQLRGTQEIPESSRNVTLLMKSGVNDRFERNLKKAFKDLGIQLVTDAPYVLSINEVRINRRSITLDRKANVDEYELLMQVNFDILNREGKPITEPLTARSERVFDYNADAATASATLEREIHQEMLQTLARRIVKQYVTRTKHQP